MEEYLEKGPSFDHTRNAHDIVGRQVLASGRSEVGRVAEVRISPDEGHFKGVLIKRGLLQKKIYISAEYIERLAKGAVLLSIDPAFLQRGMPMLTNDGKRFGKVIDLVRDDLTNKIRTYVVRRYLRTLQIPASEVKGVGRSVMLTKNYEQAKSTLIPR
jgi:sporulation protein YlmC with PRC-barrel domain